MQTQMAHFESFLRRKQLKLTSGREEILKQALRTKGHFDSESLYAALLKRKTRISRDAVFRNIPLLLEAGIIQKSVGSGKSEYYELMEPNKGHHDHMVCTECGTVIEFYSKKLEKIQEDVCRLYEFEMTFHDHRLFGYCKNCRGH